MKCKHLWRHNKKKNIFKCLHCEAERKPTKSKNTITREELSRLSFCNSKKLPTKISDNGIVKEWVGIGWIELDEKPKDDTIVVIN